VAAEQTVKKIAKHDCLCEVQDEKTTLQAETKFKPQKVQSITDATSTGENGGM